MITYDENRTKYAEFIFTTVLAKTAPLLQKSLMNLKKSAEKELTGRNLPRNELFHFRFLFRLVKKDLYDLLTFLLTT